jgi:hypothetical protein
MDKRTFLKNSAILTLGGAVAASLTGSMASAMAKGSVAGKGYVLPTLEYAYDALDGAFFHCGSHKVWFRMGLADKNQ